MYNLYLHTYKTSNRWLSLFSSQRAGVDMKAGFFCVSQRAGVDMKVGLSCVSQLASVDIQVGLCRVCFYLQNISVPNARKSITRQGHIFSQQRKV